MGNSSSYNLHKACPELNAKYDHCYTLFFENRIIPPPTPVVASNPHDPASVAAAAAASTRIVYREGVVVTDPHDIALTNQILDPSHANYACRDLWEDYKECVTDVWRQKQEAYLKRKEEATRQQANATPTSTSSPPVDKK
jgi:hypothetical protein